jgi:putative nucleotidyltransferase with HDIG domain
MTNPRVSNDQITKIISSDQAASLKVLKVVNSAFYGFAGRIDTISRAVMYLGLNEVRNLILALSVINLFKKNKALLNFRPTEFWSHSIAVGIITRLVGSSLSIKNLENYFVAGILHDIGKLVFFEFAEDDYIKVLTIVEEKNCLIKDAEKEVFGFDHSAVGDMLCEKWKIPNSIKNAIRSHHNGVSDISTGQLVAAVHIADITARTLNLGYPGDNLVPKMNKKTYEGIKLDNNFFSKNYDLLIQNFEETNKLLIS